MCVKNVCFRILTLFCMVHRVTQAGISFLVPVCSKALYDYMTMHQKESDFAVETS